MYITTLTKNIEKQIMSAHVDKLGAALPWSLTEAWDAGEVRQRPCPLIPLKENETSAQILSSKVVGFSGLKFAFMFITWHMGCFNILSKRHSQGSLCDLLLWF